MLSQKSVKNLDQFKPVTYRSWYKHKHRKHHSTESALLRVLNDILLSIDTGNSVVLLLLDLSAAFDTVDHSILISRLEHCVGIGGSVLQWFKSYLNNRTSQFVWMGARHLNQC